MAYKSHRNDLLKSAAVLALMMGGSCPALCSGGR